MKNHLLGCNFPGTRLRAVASRGAFRKPAAVRPVPTKSSWFQRLLWWLKR